MIEFPDSWFQTKIVIKFQVFARLWLTRLTNNFDVFIFPVRVVVTESRSLLITHTYLRNDSRLLGSRASTIKLFLCNLPTKLTDQEMRYFFLWHYLKCCYKWHKVSEQSIKLQQDWSQESALYNKRRYQPRHQKSENISNLSDRFQIRF